MYNLHVNLCISEFSEKKIYTLKQLNSLHRKMCILKSEYQGIYLEKYTPFYTQKQIVFYHQYICFEI